MAREKKKTKNNTASTKKISGFTFSKKQKIIFGSLLMLLSIAFLMAFISYFFTWQQDQSILSEFANRNAEAKNWLSKFGASIGHLFIYKGFGISSVAIPVLMFITGGHFFLNLEKKNLYNRWFWGILTILWFSILFGFFAEKEPLLGGVMGYELNDFLQSYIGKLGIVLLLTFTFVTYTVLRWGATPEKVFNFFKSVKKELAFELNSKKNAPVTEERQETVKHEIRNIDNGNFNSQNITPPVATDVPDVIIEDSFEVKLAKEEQETVTAEVKIEQEAESDNSHLQIQVEKIEEEKEETDILSERLVKDFGEFDPKLELNHYKFPTLELLKDHGGNTGITINQEELEENKNTIVRTLKDYKIEISQIKATIGPTVTLYEIVPSAGVRISKIKNLEDDIALSLAALGIRIIAPIPGKGTIGIEVPNKNPSIVSMRSVIASSRFQKAEMELPIAFGKTISNETFVVDLAKMPHLLMAGATGQGKSVGLNAILTSLLYKKHPAEIKFVLVDPKKVELTLFNKIERHFLAKLPDSEDAIITDNTKVINTLNSLCIEMDNRYELLKNAMVRNIKEYNTKFKARKLNPNDGHKFLPYIVLVVDEFADLIMTAGKEVETPIARLAQLARAIGIHLIIATQRPSVNVITGIIKANFPARVAFRVTSKIDSRTILDSPGADQLIGRGDMLYTQGNDIVRLQCAFVDTPEVEKITDYIGSQRAYPEAFMLPEYIGEESGTGIDVDISERDNLFNEAAEVIVTAQQGSASLLQRKLKLGYNRAGRLIDQLEAAGIVGPFEGSKARQVLIPDIVSLHELLENEKKQ
ncbi:DNA translocase FtsK [Zhouia spongiae]|uniref:DNA translocase FtsK n=1 Tax=Zhouia spongiae TaxID=2202721 RepID=A0ABY3YJ30_9FLAO|nr:DNA translocase FtsK [Zhouia spongiae]UNY97845.1 DNA translocase FtsK [Zhouia spongiae]